MRINDSLAGRTVGELARRDIQALLTFADAGISPRYVAWTVMDAARDCGVSLESLLARLERLLGSDSRAAA